MSLLSYLVHAKSQTKRASKVLKKTSLLSFLPRHWQICHYYKMHRAGCALWQRTQSGYHQASQVHKEKNKQIVTGSRKRSCLGGHCWLGRCLSPRWCDVQADPALHLRRAAVEGQSHCLDYTTKCEARCPSHQTSKDDQLVQGVILIFLMLTGGTKQVLFSISKSSTGGVEHFLFLDSLKGRTDFSHDPWHFIFFLHLKRTLLNYHMAFLVSVNFNVLL